MKNLLVAQSGGPTAAINATLAGVVSAGFSASLLIDKVLGARNALEGIRAEDFVDFKRIIKNAGDIEVLAHTPSSALGTCRVKLGADDECKEIIDIFKKHNIGYFVYIGGNDSMDTVYRLSKYCKENGIDDIFIVGAPKTIDNDLMETDHCPGFGSAAKYVATCIREIERDVSAYRVPSVTIVEIMGRDAGWLTASACLAGGSGSHGAQLIYPCETAFSIDSFVSDVEALVKKDGNVIVAVSEGIKDSEGRYISESVQSGQVDAFGHSSIISGAGSILAEIVKERLGLKVRSIELSLLQRCAAHIASGTDIEEAKALGTCALQLAVTGNTGMMSAIFRKEGREYCTEMGAVPTADVIDRVKSLPASFISPEGNNVTKECRDYLLPLIQGECHGFYENGVPKHFII